MPDKDAMEIIAEVIAAIAGPELNNLKPPSQYFPVAFDFSDLRTVLRSAGDDAFYGSGEASGEGRALKAAELAIADINRQIRRKP